MNPLAGPIRQTTLLPNKVRIRVGHRVPMCGTSTSPILLVTPPRTVKLVLLRATFPVATNLLRRAEIITALTCSGPLPLLHLTAIRSPVLGWRQGTRLPLPPCTLVSLYNRSRERLNVRGTQPLALPAVQLNTTFRLFVFRPQGLLCLILWPTLLSRLRTEENMLYDPVLNRHLSPAQLTPLTMPWVILRILMQVSDPILLVKIIRLAAIRAL